MRAQTLRTTTAGLLAAGLLAACGGGGGDEDESPTGGDTATTEEPASPAEEETAEEGGDAGQAAGTTIETTTTDLGTFLVDDEGMTLYLFTEDSPGTSVCEGQCLEAWPPLEGEAGAGQGVDPALLGTIERSDGSVQASYNDWPLYYYAPDTAPGDVTGQGVNDVWWVVSPEGEAVMGGAAAGPAAY
ncbi:hypothetical protein [Georgenia sp. AZ-5]|uniref:COG4315 family predicted lipoprotein n=1 Tax=Georgenia sp. AZ-5 TaxID=3367526 RepID=UPI003754FF71